MSGFDDANVDKDLLSQIFADGDDTDELEKLLEDSEDGLSDDLDVLLSEIEDIEVAAAEAKENEKRADSKRSRKKQKHKKNFPKKEESVTDKAEEELEQQISSQLEAAHEETISIDMSSLFASADREQAKDDQTELQPQKEEVEDTSQAVVQEKEEVSDDSDKPQNQESAKEADEKEQSAKDSKTEGETLAEVVEQEKTQDQKAKKPSFVPDGGDGTMTVITAGTTISGGITSDGSLEVMGTIKGDIESKGEVIISGTVSGSVTAAKIQITTPRIEGSLFSTGDIQIVAGSVVIGDLTGCSARISGAIKGNIDVDGTVVIEDTAVVKGDIKAKSVQINEGAILEGRVSLNYSEIDIDSIF